MIFHLIIIFIVFAVIFSLYSWKKEQERKEALGVLANEMGLEFHLNDPYDIVEKYGYLNVLRSGQGGRYAQNVIGGNFRGHGILFCDFHYETYSTDKDGRRQTHHHYVTAGILYLSKEFPELIVRPEGLFDKFAQGLGFDDIDLDNMEFSKKYMVKCKSKKFAYDIFHPRMMELFLAIGKVSLEIERDTMIIYFRGKMNPGLVRGQLDMITEIREQFPKYIFAE